MIIGQRCDNTVRDGRVEYTTVSTSHTSVVLKANRNRRQSVGSRIHLGPSPYENRGSQVGINWVRIPVLTGGGICLTTGRRYSMPVGRVKTSDAVVLGRPHAHL